MRLRPHPGQGEAVAAHFTAWHRTAGRVLAGTRLHLLLDTEPDGALVALHLFESEETQRRALSSDEHGVWLAALLPMLEEPPAIERVSVRWNAATEARPKVSVSIDRDVHASVQDLIARLIERHPRTPAEDLYLSMLESIAHDYEQEYPAYLPEEGDPR
jgi:hypothetical protein